MYIHFPFFDFPPEFFCFSFLLCVFYFVSSRSPLLLSISCYLPLTLYAPGPLVLNRIAGTVNDDLIEYTCFPTKYLSLLCKLCISSHNFWQSLAMSEDCEIFRNRLSVRSSPTPPSTSFCLPLSPLLILQFMYAKR